MKNLATLIFAALLLPAAAGANDDLLTSQMVDQARAWSQKGRQDLAADVWRKLLETDRRHPEGLVKLGLIEAREGNLEAAQALHRRASQLTKTPDGLKELSALLGSGPATDRAKPVTKPAAAVAAAPLPPPPVVAAPQASPQAPIPKEPQRTAVSKVVPPAAIPAGASGPAALAPKVQAVPQAGSNAAPKLNPRVTKGTPEPSATAPVAPKPSFATELAALQTPQAVGERWVQTRAELERLAQAHPKELRYRVALAIHLTHRETSRREGIRQLAAIAEQGQGTRESKKAWRAALLELSPRDGDRALLSQFLTRYPADSAVAEQRRNLDQRATVVSEPKVAQAPLPAAPATVRLPTGEAEKSAAQDVVAATLADARQLAGRQQWSEALNRLEKIPQAQRTRDVVTEQRAVWVKAQSTQARQFYEQGDTARASAAQESAQKAARTDAILQAFVGAGWVDMAQPEKGLAALRQVAAGRNQENLDDSIKLAEGLFQARQDSELRGVLRRLSEAPRLSPTQRDEVNEIILRLTLRLAEQARDAGRIAQATELLIPVLRGTGEGRVVIAMARIHRAAGQPGQGLPLIENLIIKEPTDTSHRWLAAELAMDAKALDKADEHLKSALKQSPDNPRLLAAAGRLEQLRGDAAKAIALFQKAQVQERDAKAFAGLPALLALRLVGDASASVVPVVQVAPVKADAIGTSLLPIPGIGQTPLRAAATKPVATHNADVQGFVRLAADDPGQAGESFARQLRQRPNDPLAMNNLAVAKAVMGSLDTALELFRRAHLKGPERADIRANYELLKRWSGRNQGTDLGTAARPLQPLPPLWPTGVKKNQSAEKPRTSKP